MIVDAKPYWGTLEAITPVAVCFHHAGNHSGVLGCDIIAFGGIPYQIIELWRLV
jgi:hypothetical protein